MHLQLERTPRSAAAWDWLAMAYAGLEQFNSSLGAYDTALALARNASLPRYPRTELLAGRAHTLALMGDKVAAVRELRELYDLRQRRKAYVEPVRLAFVEAGLGHVDAAIALLYEAAALKQWELAFVRSEPWFDPLRHAPGYEGLLKRIGFPSSVSATSAFS